MTALVALLSLFAAVLSEEKRSYRRRKTRPDGAGVLITDGSRSLLLLRADEVSEPLTWGIPGGSLEPGELPLHGALREVAEEIGDLPRPGILAGQVTTPSGDGRTFTTFVWLVDPEILDHYTPRLNWEHDSFLVANSERMSRMNLHPGLRVLFEGEVPGLGTLGAWPTRKDMDRLAARLYDDLFTARADEERMYTRQGDDYYDRDSFDDASFFEGWTWKEPRMRFLGCGMDRAAFLTPRGVLKISFGRGGCAQCLAEATVWKEAPPSLRQHLVPVLDVHPDGSWVLAERAIPALASDSVPRDLLREMWWAGIYDLGSDNLTADGRVLDYGTVDWKKWRKLVPDTSAFR